MSYRVAALVALLSVSCASQVVADAAEWIVEGRAFKLETFTPANGDPPTVAIFLMVGQERPGHSTGWPFVTRCQAGLCAVDDLGHCERDDEVIVVPGGSLGGILERSTCVDAHQGRCVALTGKFWVDGTTAATVSDAEGCEF